MSAYKPSLIEKETIILFNEAESEAEIYTYNQKLINRLKKHPAIAKLKRKDDTGAYTFIVPKKQMTISIREPISEELREIRRKSGLSQIGKGIIAEPKQNVKGNGKNNP